MRVLGIDPGLSITGYACVDGGVDGAMPRLVEAGCFRFVATRSVSERLVELEADLVALVERTGAKSVCVESLFAHYEHPRTAITMGHARGVILLVAARAGLTLVELPPARIKKAITGSGRASKEQMQQAVAAQMGLTEVPEPSDVADAIAIAICGARRVESEAQV